MRSSLKNRKKFCEACTESADRIASHCTSGWSARNETLQTAWLPGYEGGCYPRRFAAASLKREGKNIGRVGETIPLSAAFRRG